ncbi:uncharacterized protein METZ01_LOCUS190321 [marine metagenome]|uniref:N-acetyl-alpha-D-glucosaminyl L-malate synthase BshA n=1 Tax=marine metagenome TaxID=408172 RepID=A0A382DIN0_9ZZZZ
MKIGITCYPTYGGSGAVATSLGSQLALRGHEVHFISYAQPFRLGPFNERIFFHEVEIEHYPLFEHPPYALALAVTIYDAVRTHNLDLVHVHYAIPHATSAWIAQEMLGEDGPPVVTTLHGTDITLVGVHPSFQPITQFSILRSDGITAVSHYLKDETIRDFDVPAERVKVIPNFVDSIVDREPDRGRYRSTMAKEEEKVVMHVSNFRPVKRVLDVIEIFSGIVTVMPARLVMIGDGPERSAAMERAKILGIADKVTFLGKHSHVDELLSCADLFLLPSSSESFGLAALEAMATGTPVVASNVGGIKEVIVDGETGYLCEVGDVRKMTDSSIQLLSSPSIWKAFSECGLTVVKDRFSATKIVPCYEKFYAEIMGSK